jgi:hypothetical protein
MAPPTMDSLAIELKERFYRHIAAKYTDLAQSSPWERNADMWARLARDCLNKADELQLQRTGVDPRISSAERVSRAVFTATLIEAAQMK